MAIMQPQPFTQSTGCVCVCVLWCIYPCVCGGVSAVCVSLAQINVITQDVKLINYAICLVS